jgi:hypothetical protein
MPEDDIDIESLTPEEQGEILNLAERIGAGYPTPEEKSNIYSFFKRVLETKDTTKVSNVDEPEIYAERQLKNAALFIDKLGFDKVSEYLTAKSEVIASTSLGRKGFLILSAITQKRFLSTDTKREETGGGKKWFWGKKKEEQPQI